MTVGLKSPGEIVDSACSIGKAKSENNWLKLLVLAFLAGAYIAFGGTVAIATGRGITAEGFGGLSKLVFAGTFPVGLMLVVIAGAELFTGNVGVITPSCLSGKAKWVNLLRNWGIVYVGNFIGSVFLAFLVSNAGGALFKADPYLAATKAIAEGKVVLTFWQVFWRGVGCNWLVCLAVWLAVSANDVTGKIWGIWFPIMAFVAIGFEHSVANMFFIPLGMFNGANVTWVQFIVNNLIPSTLGNIIGGGFFVGVIYWWIYGRQAK